MSILELEGVSYSYASKKSGAEVLSNICCSFCEGKIYAIAGKSGSGKSTLLSLMAGLDLPTGGRVLFEGRPTTKINPEEYRRECAAVIYQDFCLFPLLTVLENIMYPMELCHVEKNEAKRQASELAEKVSLPDALFNRFPSKISGGEQQRVAIARALAMNRRLILADEPTGNLDGENSEMIMDILCRLAHEENRCVIVVTHDIPVMRRADVIFRITDGKITEDKELFG